MQTLHLLKMLLSIYLVVHSIKCLTLLKEAYYPEIPGYDAICNPFKSHTVSRWGTQCFNEYVKSLLPSISL